MMKRGSVINIAQTVTESEASWTRSPWTLVYASSSREEAFWKFAIPQFPRGDTFLAIASAITASYVNFLSTPTDREEFRIGYFVVTLFLMFLAVVQVSLHVGEAVGCVMLSSAVFGSRVVVGLISLCVIFFGLLANYGSAVDGDCQIGTLFEDEGQVYSERNCTRYLSGWVTVMMTLVVQFKLSLYAVIVMAVSTVVMCAPLSFYYPLPTFHMHLHIPFTASIGAFAVFVRYHRERIERDSYESHEFLKEEINELQVRGKELHSFCRTVIPAAVLEQASQRSRDFIDASSSTAALCVSVHDFARHCTQDTPLGVAQLVETLRSRLQELIDANELQIINVIQDQITAVGNLISEMNLTVAVYRCCSVALSAISEFEVSEGPALRAAVNRGPVAGGFIGKHWVRYDAVGEGMLQCHAALQAADRNCAILTGSAFESCKDHVSVTHFGTLSDEGEAAPLNEVVELYRLVSLNSASALPDPHDTGPFHRTRQLSISNSSAYTTASQHSAGGIEAIENVHKVLDNVGNTADAGPRFKLVPEWGIMERFANAKSEQKYLDNRVLRTTGDTARTWLAFAWLVLVFLCFLMLDFEGNNAPLAAILLALGALLSVAAAAFPIALSKTSLLRFHMMWSLSAILVPLEVLFASAVARPSMVGNDVRTLLAMGTFVRSTCFREAKYQLVAKPLMLFLAQIHLFLPGATLRTVTFFAYAIVLYSIAIDRDDDKMARRRYVVEEQLRKVRTQLSEEQDARENLLRSTMPPVIFRHLKTTLREPHHHRGSSKVLLQCASESVVMFVTGSVNFGSTTSSLNGSVKSQGPGFTSAIILASRALETLEKTLQRYPHLTLVTLFGDTAMVVTPVLPIAEEQAEEAPYGATLISNTLSSALEITACGERNVIMETDETLQVTRVSGVPSFGVYGPGVTRLLAVLAAADRAALQGVVVTERVLAIATEENAQALQQTKRIPLGPMKVRGAGIIRLTRIQTGTAL